MDSAETPNLAADAGQLLRDCERDALALLCRISGLAECSYHLAAEHGVSPDQVALGEQQILELVRTQTRIVEGLTQLHACYGCPDNSPFSADVIAAASGGSK